MKYGMRNARVPRAGRWLFALLILVGLYGVTGERAAAFLDEVLLAPKTLIDRAIEARSSSDIVKDNQVVLDINAVMADVGTIKASTEIYEQRLLITGLFSDKAAYDKFEAGVRAVKGVKKLYWHVAYLSEAEQKKREKELLDWADALALDTKVGLNLVGTAGVADVNLRVAVDAFGTTYLIGRARSQEELKKTLQVARKTAGVRKVVNYIDVRP
jgi:hyperosmotically inducible protein